MACVSVADSQGSPSPLLAPQVTRSKRPHMLKRQDCDNSIITSWSGCKSKPEGVWQAFRHKMGTGSRHGHILAEEPFHSCRSKYEMAAIKYSKSATFVHKYLLSCNKCDRPGLQGQWTALSWGIKGVWYARVYLQCPWILDWSKGLTQARSDLWMLPGMPFSEHNILGWRLKHDFNPPSVMLQFNWASTECKM